MTDRIPRISRSAAWRAGFIEAQGFRCHYCNRPGGPAVGPDARAWHVDHKDPLADGGEDVEENLVLACKRCNIAKGVEPYKRFRAHARVAFWCEAPVAATEQELTDLLSAWIGTEQGAWSHRRGSEREDAAYEVWCRPEGEISDTADDLVLKVPPDSGRRTSGWSTVELLVRAHRLVPTMIAEIRTLRAELAEARGESVDDPQAA